jgi:hypothetical protein
MDPVMGIRSYHSRPIIHKKLPFDGLINARLHIIPLDSREHEGKHAVAECIGSCFDELSTPLASLVHPCKTEISVEHARD